MNAVTIHAIRAQICSAIADLGGVSDRLSELEQSIKGDITLSEDMKSEMREEMADWLVQASETLNKAAALSEAGE